MKIRFVTVIWGEAFVDIFLRVALRGLLAEGNALDLAREHEVRYTIYTTAKDAEAIGASPLFARLCEKVQVRFSIFEINEIDAQNSSSHGQLWLRGLELARRNAEVLFLIIPDILYAVGTLQRWAALFERGYGAVYTPGPFVALETALVEIEKQYPDRNAAISMDTRDIHRLIGRHLHPLEAAMLRGSNRRVGHPEHDIRPVGNSGFVIRAYTSQPFCVDPKRFNSIRLFNVEDHIKLIAIEPCSVASLEPLYKSAGWLMHPARLDNDLIGQLGQWWEIFGIRGCLEESRHTYSVCVDDGEAWRKALPTAVASGGVLQMRLFAARKIFKIIQKLNEIGQRRSAQLVAMALFSGHALKLLRIPADAIILVPEDQSFGDGSLVEPIMAAGCGRQLVDALMDHVVASTAVLDKRRGIRIVSGPHTVDEFSIYVVENGKIVSPLVANGNRRDGSTIPVSQPSLTEAVRRSANDIGDLTRRGLNRWRGPIRRIQLFVEPLPLIGPVAVKSMTVLRIFRTEGFIGIRRRLASHPRYSIHRLRNALARRVGRKAMPASEVQAGESMQPAPLSTFPSIEDQNALGEVRLLKSLVGMQSVLPEYESSCLPETIKSAPAEFIHGRLEAFTAGGGARAAMARVLDELVTKHPDWCEAWLELGHVNVEMGKATEAEAAFLKASKARHFTDSGDQFQNPLSVAFLERAGLLAARGDMEGACNAYRHGFANDSRPYRVARAEFARLLQEAGDFWGAAEQFYQAAHCDVKFRPAPKAGRDAAAITFSALTARDRKVTVSSKTS